MRHQLVTVPCLTDNYAYLLHDSATGETAVIDLPEAEPLIAALDARGWVATQALITHHHSDHIDGLVGLQERFPGVRVIGAAADQHRLPKLDQAVREGETLTVAGTRIEVIDVSGHTVGHIAYHAPELSVVYTADSLMALGCGRLFEGTPGQMWQSMQKLMRLPPETLVCSGHEYTETNARFALTVEPGNPALQARAAAVTAARAKGEATVPSLLSLELATNPYLRVHLASVKQGVGMPDAGDEAVFAEVRERKNRF